MTDRTSATAVNSLFLERWSPRAFDGSDMPDADLATILEAGRWAPSAFNYQPWRFLYAKRGYAHWEPFLSALIPFNQSWVVNASVLLFIASEETSGAPDRPNHSHSFDAGAAWAMIALQAHMLGYHAHGMTGLDFPRARDVLALPEGFRVEAGVAIGRRGDVSVLPEALREREVKSDRKPLDQMAFAGPFVA